MDTLEAREMAVQLISQHLDDKWTFKFDNAKNRFGVCRFSRKEIGLSAPLVILNDETKVRNTILHEIAHAVAGPGHGHDSYWASKCRELGIKPERCYDSKEVAVVKGAYEGTCPSCGLTAQRHRRTDKMFRVACSACCKQFNKGEWSEDFKFQWTHNGRPIVQGRLGFNW